MYSKSNYRDNNDIIIPDNYRGNAFSGGLIPEEPPIIELPPPEDSTEPAAVKESTKEEVIPVQSEHNSFLSSLMPPKVSNPSGILSNIGLEELLIVGVLILLSQSDTDDDILLLLFLLLFYK